MIKNIPLSDYLITGVFIINLYYDYFFLFIMVFYCFKVNICS